MNYDIKVSDKGIKFCYPNYNDSKIAKSETNDCVVRAIAAAYDIKYDKAHKFVADEMGRSNRDGTRTYYIIQWMNSGRRKFSKKAKQLGIEVPYRSEIQLKRKVVRRGKEIYRNYTTTRFIKDYSKGIYVILVRAHAFTIIDGVVVGNYTDGIQGRKRIEYAWKIN